MEDSLERKTAAGEAASVKQYGRYALAAAATSARCQAHERPGKIFRLSLCPHVR